MQALVRVQAHMLARIVVGAADIGSWNRTLAGTMVHVYVRTYVPIWYVPVVHTHVHTRSS